jgi:hypothetical protein
LLLLSFEKQNRRNIIIKISSSSRRRLCVSGTEEYEKLFSSSLACLMYNITEAK